MLIVLENYYEHFENDFPSLDQKVIPYSLNFPQKSIISLRLRLARENSDKVGGTIQRRVDILVFEMGVQIRKVD